MHLVRPTLTVGAIAISMLLTLSAFANEAPMRITDVRFTDLNDPTQIEIVGTQFDNGEELTVTFGGGSIDASLSGSTGTLVRAEIPANTPDGDYTITVSTGPGAKQNAEHGLTVAPLVEMSVTCIDWFITAGHGEHIHNELHVEDEFGDAVLGATVTYTNAWNGDVFQTNVSATTKTAGHNRGEGCSEPTGDGVTGWFCCIGAGKFDAGGEVPGKRSCPAGEYTAAIVSVEPPPGTTLVWDGESPGGETVHFDPF
jgi:hypothetical protein